MIYSFAETTMTCKGKIFPVEYSIAKDGSVLVSVIFGVDPNGYRQKQRIAVRAGEPEYVTALAAAKAAAASGKRPENIPTGYRKISTPAGNIIKPLEAVKPKPERAADTVQAQPKQSACTSKQERGVNADKSFVGKVIKGNGWKIFFDGSTSRTRVIFDTVPTAAAKEVVECAGFYYSKTMNSWNKKLTCKAHRAAMALSEQLNELYAA